jgi:hypothetical protein
LADQRPVDELLFAETLVALAALDVENLVILAGIALLFAEVEDAALGTVEAVLLAVLDEGRGEGAAGEVVAGRPLEHVHLVVAGSSRPEVPVLSLEVTLEVAVVQVHQPLRRLRVHPARIAVESVESSIEVADVESSLVLNIEQVVSDEGAVDAG